MEMRARTVSRIPDITDDIASCYNRAGGHREAGTMRVQSKDSIAVFIDAVVYHYKVSVTSVVPTGGIDDSFSRGMYGRA